MVLTVIFDPPYISEHQAFFGPREVRPTSSSIERDLGFRDDGPPLLGFAFEPRREFFPALTHRPS